MVRGNFLATSEAPLSLTPRPQVLFKRKPVQFLPVPEIEDENQEVRTLDIPPRRWPIDHSWILTTLCDIGLAYLPDR
jgi:hypothetical protein